MKQFITGLFVICSAGCAFSQTEPKVVGYFNLGWQRVTEGEAAFYRTVEPAGDQFLVKDYYKSGKLQMQAICSAYEPKLIWKGVTKLYHENGVVSEEGMFVNEARMGMHTYWYEDGKKKKEVIHGGEGELIAQFWSKEGTPLLVNGNGIVQETFKETTQYHDVVDSVYVTSFTIRNGTDTLYIVIPQLPEYIGGLNEMMRDLKAGIKYPKKARKDGTAGRVYVKFTVDKRGMVKDAEVLKGVSPECDAESLRVVSTLHHWNPGRWRGKPVDAAFVLPINFALK